MPDPRAAQASRLFEVGRLFLRLGCTAFGGPAAHVAVMEDEVVQRRAWVTREQFADLVAASAIIPGPNSTELAMHLGYRRAGWPGLYLAGLAFLLPAVGMVWGLAWLYATGTTRLAVAPVLAAIQPAVLAIVVQAVWRLRTACTRTRWTGALAVGTLAASVAGVSELWLLGMAAGIGLLIGSRRLRSVGPLALAWMPPGVGAGVAVPVAATALGSMLSPWAVFLSFARIGSLLFGSGYVLLPVLRGEFVTRLGVLPDAVLLDALAIGQVTPGPLFATATFVGFQLAGHAGAAAATLGIFLPAFAAVTLTAPLVARWRQTDALAALLDAVQAAAVALMAAVVLQLTAPLARDPLALAILGGSAVLLLRTPIGSGWVLLLAALLGWLRAL